MREFIGGVFPFNQYFSSGENFDANTPGVELSRLGGAQSFADYCPFQTVSIIATSVYCGMCLHKFSLVHNIFACDMM